MCKKRLEHFGVIILALVNLVVFLGIVKKRAMKNKPNFQDDTSEIKS